MNVYGIGDIVVVSGVITNITGFLSDSIITVEKIEPLTSNIVHIDTLRCGDLERENKELKARVARLEDRR